MVKSLSPPHSLYRYHLRFKFITYLGLILFFFVSVVFYWMFVNTKAHIIIQLDMQARALLQQVVLTRAWVADHGGLFILKQHGVLSNPMIPDSGITDQEGREFVFRNPAMVTRELSEYADKEGLYKFRLTSLKLRNPENAPSPFEKKALNDFKKNGFEASRNGLSYTGQKDGALTYQRIVPLEVEDSCLECHADQGYQVGEVRGGLNVILPMDEAINSIKRSRNTFFFVSIAIICLVSALVYLLLWKMVLKPVDSLKLVAERIIAGEYNVRAEVNTGDELESFADAFNQMTKRLKRGYEGAFKSLIAAMEARDSYTKGHTERVALLSMEIGRVMGLAEEDMEELELGAILHDIGKIGISDNLLLKASRLEKDEFSTMKSHVDEGVKIITGSHFLNSAIPAIKYHHERLDGKGYPGGVSGEKLPLVARIIAVADTYDAMTTDRPYRKALDHEAALAEIEKYAGSQFDPEVVAALLKSAEKHSWS